MMLKDELRALGFRQAPLDPHAWWRGDAQVLTINGSGFFVFTPGKLSRHFMGSETELGIRWLKRNLPPLTEEK